MELSRHNLEDYCQVNNLQIVPKFQKTLSEIVSENELNREGYVVTYLSTGLKVKVKFEEYVRLHKVLTGLNVHSIWELMKDGNMQTINEWMRDDHMSLEFKAWLSNTTTELARQFESLVNTIMDIYDARPVGVIRKELAVYFLLPEHKQYSSVLFGLEDKRNTAEMIWNRIEPRGGIKSFRVEGE